MTEDIREEPLSLHLLDFLFIADVVLLVGATLFVYVFGVGVIKMFLVCYCLAIIFALYSFGMYHVWCWGTHKTMSDNVLEERKEEEEEK